MRALVEDAATPLAVPCTVCGHRGRGAARPRFLPHGVHVWLCAVHGTLSFMSRDCGRELARRLQQRWEGAGMFGARRRKALAAHIDRLRRLGGDVDKPGSHSWPKLRQEAERRFAAGDDPATVILQLRIDVSGGPAIAPSIRTFRRWFAQGRWLLPAPEPEPNPDSRALGGAPATLAPIPSIRPDLRE